VALSHSTKGTNTGKLGNRRGSRVQRFKSASSPSWSSQVSGVFAWDEGRNELAYGKRLLRRL